MDKQPLDIGSGLTWIGTLLQYIKEYGILGFIKALFILLFAGLILNICYNPGWIIDKCQEYITQKHEIELYKRAEYDNQIKNLLPIYLYKYHADRV